MQKLVSAVFVALLLATGSTLAIAQNSSNNNASPAQAATASTNPDLATKKDIAALKGTIAKTAKQQEAQRKADADRTAQQLIDLKVKQDTQHNILLNSVKADTKAMADQQVAQAKTDTAQLHRTEFRIAIFVIVAWTSLFLLVRKNHKTMLTSSSLIAKEALKLPVNASVDEVNAYIAATKKRANEKFDFTFEVKIDNPNDLTKSIALGQIVGKIYLAADGIVRYTIDGYDVPRGKMASTFRDAFYERARQEARNQNKIHVVRVA